MSSVLFINVNYLKFKLTIAIRKKNCTKSKIAISSDDYLLLSRSGCLHYLWLSLKVIEVIIMDALTFDVGFSMNF